MLVKNLGRYYALTTKFLWNEKNIPQRLDEVLYWGLAAAVHGWNRPGNSEGKTFSQYIHEDPDINSVMNFLIRSRIFACLAIYFWPLIALWIVWKHKGYRMIQWIQALQRPDLYLAYPLAAFSTQAIQERRSDILVGIFNFWHYFHTKCPDYTIDHKAVFEEKAKANHLPVVVSMSLEEARKIQPPYFVKDPSKDAGLGVHQCQSYDELVTFTQGKDVLIQQVLTNHPALLAILPPNPPLCTLRLTTILSSNKYECINAYFRIGASNSAVDNVCRGGMMVEVDLKTGRLQEGVSHEMMVGVDKLTPLKLFWDVELPGFKACIELAEKSHQLLGANLAALGWDIALTLDGPVLIEANTFPAAYETFRFNDAYRRLNQSILEKIASC